MRMPGPEATTRVTILGEEYQIRGGERGLVQDLAAQVDGRFRALQAVRPTLDLRRLAVMVCLNLAEELHQERAVHGDLLRTARERTRQCRDSLEDVLREEGRSEAQPAEA